MAATQDLQALLEQTSWIQALARRLVTDPNLAEDLAQDTWVDALERTPDGGRPLRGWLATVMRNNLGKRRRSEANRAARERANPRAEELPSTLEVVEKASTHRDVVLAVLGLDEPYRSTVLMRYFEGRSYREIARATGVTKATVNSRITRGLERLRARLETTYGDRRALHLALAPLAFRPAGAIETLLGTKTMILTTTTASLALVTVAVSTGHLGGVGSRAGAVEPTAPTARTTADTRVEESLGVPAALFDEPRAEAPALGAVAALDPSGQRTQEERRHEYWEAEIFDVRAIPLSVERLSVDLSSGDVELLPSRSGNLEIDGKVRARLDLVEAHLLTQVFEDHVRFVEEEGRLKIEDAHRNERGWGRLPRRARPGRPARGREHRVGGHPRCAARPGKVAANTGSGDILLEIQGEPVAAAALNTGSGDVTVDIASLGMEGSLMANTGSGGHRGHPAGPAVVRQVGPQHGQRRRHRARPHRDRRGVRAAQRGGGPDDRPGPGALRPRRRSAASPAPGAAPARSGRPSSSPAAPATSRSASRVICARAETRRLPERVSGPAALRRRGPVARFEVKDRTRYILTGDRNRDLPVGAASGGDAAKPRQPEGRDCDLL